MPTSGNNFETGKMESGMKRCYLQETTRNIHEDKKIADMKWQSLPPGHPRVVLVQVSTFQLD